ncbi:MAG: heme exporter protein CcmB [Sulfuricellaceae bacterium]|nr:heme exporter protein CcmB [Sulfuricellaceae bacterium]
MSFFKTIYLIAWKDILSELRSRENILSMLFFALLMIFIFNFALPLDAKTVDLLMPGLIWIAFAFTSIIGLGRSFQAEKDNDCLEALLIAPVSKGAVYLGKFLGNFLFVLTAEAGLVPLFILFFNLEIGSNLPMLLGIFALGTFGLSALGTLFSAMTAQIRAREVMFPILVLPLAVPVLIGAIQATAGVLHHTPWGQYSQWVQLLLVFDVIFIIVAFWTFEFILEA